MTYVFYVDDRGDEVQYQSPVLSDYLEQLADQAETEILTCRVDWEGDFVRLDAKAEDGDVFIVHIPYEDDEDDEVRIWHVPGGVVDDYLREGTYERNDIELTDRLEDSGELS